MIGVFGRENIGVRLLRVELVTGAGNHLQLRPGIGRSQRDQARRRVLAEEQRLRAL